MCLYLISDEVNTMEESVKIESTLKQEKLHVNKLRAFLKNYPALDIDFTSCSPDELAKVLRLFFGSLKKKDGSFYAPASLICIRASLFRFFMRSRKINIISDDQFFDVNATLKCLARKFIVNGGQASHFHAIESEDLEVLSNYFDRSNPVVLLQETYYNIIYYFGTRGREWFRNIKEEDFIFSKDSNGQDIVRFNEGKMKNVGNDFSKEGMESIKEAVMVSCDDKKSCPVTCLLLYMEKRRESISKDPESVPFFLKARKNFQGCHWYCEKQPIGVNTLGQLMKTISSDAKLSQKYTAHCIRPTVISELADAGYTPPDICKITGQKQTRTVERYLQFGSRRISKMKQMSQSLKRSLHGRETNDKPSMQDTAEDDAQGMCVLKRAHEVKVHAYEEFTEGEEFQSYQKQPTAILEKNGAKLMFFL